MKARISFKDAMDFLSKREVQENLRRKYLVRKITAIGDLCELYKKCHKEKIDNPALGGIIDEILAVVRSNRDIYGK